MKKLMIAAAAAAMVGGAFAECQEYSCASAYRVKLAGKTCIAKAKAGNASKCEEGTCWLKPGSLRIAGYFYGFSEEALDEENCESCACQDSFMPNILLWNENKKQVHLAGEVDVNSILRNGGDKAKSQIGFKLGDLYCAGFGKMSYKTYEYGLLKQANGFFAGTLDAPTCAGAYDEKTCEEGDPVAAKAFAPCTLEEEAPEKVIAFGRWNLQYKADKVKKIEKTGTIDCLYPTGFVATEQ